MKIALDPYMLRTRRASHPFHRGNMVETMQYAGPLPTQPHLADSFDHRGSSGLRYIDNLPGSAARIHQHLERGPRP